MMRTNSTCFTHESQKRQSLVRSMYGEKRSTLHSAKYCVSAADMRSFVSRQGKPPFWHLVISASRGVRTRTLVDEVGSESTNCEGRV